MFDCKDGQVGECEEARQRSCKGCRVVLQTNFDDLNILNDLSADLNLTLCHMIIVAFVV